MASHHLRVSILKSSCPVCSYTACSKTFWETEEDKSICWQRSSFCRKKRNKSLHHINESWDFRATFCRWAAIYLVLFELSFQIKSSECFQRKPLLHQSSSTSFWFLINTTQTRSTKAAFSCRTDSRWQILSAVYSHQCQSAPAHCSLDANKQQL